MDLRADCARCAGLCCVAPAFAASADFAIDKPAGRPCPNLLPGFGCGIHDRLRDRGFSGCAAFDCFGAGQRVVQVTFGGRDWRAEPELARPMFATFATMRHLHELLWHLTEALALPRAGALRDELRGHRDRIEALAGQDPQALAVIDVTGLRGEVHPLLRRVSALCRPAPGRDLGNADLVGADLREARLRGASLRGAVLVGARLARADLRDADLAGADLRGADLAGADLTGCLFLTQAQLDAATGDRRTRLPDGRPRPVHWPTEPTGPTRQTARRR